MTTRDRELPREWDAGVYHRVSTPQVGWGLKLLQRLPLQGNETVADVGCGTGLLTAELLSRLPEGRVLAVDSSQNMLDEAAAHLARHGDRVAFHCLDAQTLHLPEPVDVIFSTATFHWVTDHPRLFRALFRNLKPGGQLLAQCGGGPNIERLHSRAEALLASPSYREAALGWRHPWEFASPEETAQRLSAAGFIDIETGLESAPASFPTAAAFQEFVRTAVLRTHLEAIADEQLRRAFLAKIAELAAADLPPFTLDYWRLNMSARRPLAA